MMADILIMLVQRPTGQRLWERDLLVDQRAEMIGYQICVGIVLAVVSQPKAPGVEKVLRPKLTLVEQAEAERKHLDTWIISEIHFVHPRLIMVDVPGKGRQVLWYMVYRVTNRDKKPRYIMPQFLLVDDKGRVYKDVIIPKAQRAIQLREYPMQPLLNSVTITGPLEPSSEEGVANSKYGVATWEGVKPDFQSFSIFVVGLSNAYKRMPDPKTGKEAVLRKTLQLKFLRPGDEYHLTEREIRYEGFEWVYR